MTNVTEPPPSGAQEEYNPFSEEAKPKTDAPVGGTGDRAFDRERESVGEKGQERESEDVWLCVVGGRERGSV